MLDVVAVRHLEYVKAKVVVPFKSKQLKSRLGDELEIVGSVSRNKEMIGN